MQSRTPKETSLAVSDDTIGTHPALVSQKEAFALERDKQVKIADNERVIRIGQINALFEFQVKAANDIRKVRPIAPQGEQT